MSETIAAMKTTTSEREHHARDVPSRHEPPIQRDSRRRRGCRRVRGWSLHSRFHVLNGDKPLSAVRRFDRCPRWVKTGHARSQRHPHHSRLRDRSRTRLPPDPDRAQPVVQRHARRRPRPRPRRPPQPAPAATPAEPTTLGEDASSIPEPKHAHIRRFGQTGTDDGIQFTLDPPTIRKSVSFHGYSATPDAHGRFVLLKLRIVNNSGSKVVDPCPDWHLFDTRKRVYKPYSRFAELKTNKNLCATLPKGGTQVGTLVFDVDRGSRPARGRDVERRPGRLRRREGPRPLRAVMLTISTTRLSAFIAIGVVLACVPLLVVLSRSPGSAPIEPAAAPPAAPAPAPKVARAASHSAGSIASQFLDNSRGLVESAAAPSEPIPTRAPTTQRTIRHFGESGTDAGVEFTAKAPDLGDCDQARAVAAGADAARTLPARQGHGGEPIARGGQAVSVTTVPACWPSMDTSTNRSGAGGGGTRQPASSALRLEAGKAPTL